MAFFLNRHTAQEKSLGIYVHIPFCKSRCEYCDFYSNGGGKDSRMVDEYLQALADHIRETGKLAPDYVVDTVYFGGGTPSYFGAENLDKILDEIQSSFHLGENPEITFEANPDSVTEQGLKKLLRAGFNRISIGVQSDDDEILHNLGRSHNFAQAKEAMELARKVGFANISLDLMYGLPNQTMEGWMRTVERIVHMRPEHISCYGLRIEENTKMWKYHDRLNLPNDDMQADMYFAASQYLKEHGYEHYEVSNFAKKGFASRHNMKYWTGEEYIGFGPSAASDFAGKRFTILSDLRGYNEGIAKQRQVLSECESIPPRARAGEYLMLRLRTNLGIMAKEYEKQFLLSFEPLQQKFEQYQKNGFAEFINDRWCLTEKGWYISNTIIVQLQEEQERSRRLTRKDILS